MLAFSGANVGRPSVSMCMVSSVVGAGGWDWVEKGLPRSRDMLSDCEGAEVERGVVRDCSEASFSGARTSAVGAGMMASGGRCSGA